MDAEELRRLPGGELLERGLADLEAGRQSTEAFLLEIAAGRLRRSGVALPELPPSSTAAELRLYEHLGRHFDDPYGRYNSLLRRLISLERALETRPGSSPDSRD